MIQLTSKLDKSVNFVEENLKGFIESRYVRRTDRYFSCYLSSQTGCNKGCQFCHLTATGQTAFDDVNKAGFLDQAENVFKHYLKEKPAEWVNYSFMARGEALANKHLLDAPDSILIPLGELAVKHDLRPKFNISTIMPSSLKKRLIDIFRIVTPTIYYSLYSINEDFRRTWLPAAMPVKEALAMLGDYQSFSKKLVRIHFAFIRGQNDSIDDVEEMCRIIEGSQLLCEFNLVRYNPFSQEQGDESSDEVIQRNLEIIKARMGGRAKIIKRVGFDVYASCGTFVSKG